MKRIYLGILTLSIISILSAFSVSNKKSTDDQCGCLVVDKKSISGKNKNEFWYEKVCGTKCGTCPSGYNDKWNAKNLLQNKYDKMYSGTDFKVTMSFVADYWCE